MRSRRSLLRPQTGRRKFLSQVFEDSKRFPDASLAVNEDGHLAGTAQRNHALLEVLRFKRDHRFFESNAGNLHRQPGPERPRRIVLVTDDQMQTHAHFYSGFLCREILTTNVLGNAVPMFSNADLLALLFFL